MRSLNTKQGRETARETRFQLLTEKGYIRETYKDVEIFTNFKDDKYFLCTFIGNSTKMVHNFYSTKPFTARIEDIKATADRREQNKAQRKTEKRVSSQAATATAIRTELKTIFPDVKFSVKSEGFAGGDAVRISWTDGPTTEMVDGITKKYQYGSFNGMEDMYEYSNTRKDIPQAKYVQTQRNISAGVYETVQAALAEKFEAETPYELERMTYAIVNKNIIPVGAVVNGLVTLKNAGLTEDVFGLKFEGMESLSKVAATIADDENGSDEIQVVDYSEKSFAITGETRKIKKDLKRLGGRWNKNLSCGPGWIFSKKQFDQVDNFLTTKANV